MSENTIFILKVTLPLATGVFGGIEVFNKGRERGRPAKCLSLAIIVVTAAAAAAIAGYDERRPVPVPRPFRVSGADYVVLLPNHRLMVDEYLGPHERDFHDSVQKLTTGERLAGIADPDVQYDEDDYISAFEFNEDCALFPSPAEKLPYGALGGSTLIIELYRTPIDLAEHPYLNSTSQRSPDVVFRVATEAGSPGSKAAHHVEAVVRPKGNPVNAMRLRLHARVGLDGIDRSTKSHQISGVDDLRSAQIFARIVSGPPNKSLAAAAGDIAAVRRGCRLDELRITVESGEHFVLNEKIGLRLVSHPENGQDALYEYRFPSDQEEFEKRMRD